MTTPRVNEILPANTTHGRSNAASPQPSTPKVAS